MTVRPLFSKAINPPTEVCREPLNSVLGGAQAADPKTASATSFRPLDFADALSAQAVPWVSVRCADSARNAQTNGFRFAGHVNEA